MLALYAALCLLAACDRPAGHASAGSADGTRAPPHAMDLYGGLSTLAAAPAADTPARLAAYLDRHFPAMCEADTRFSLDRVCQTPGDPGDSDPSPWPEVLLGLAGERVVVVALTRPEARLGAPWSCEAPSPIAPVRLCFLPDAVPADRARWAGEWVRFFMAAD